MLVLPLSPVLVPELGSVTLMFVAGVLLGVLDCVAVGRTYPGHTNSATKSAAMSTTTATAQPAAALSDDCVAGVLITVAISVRV